MQKIISIQVSPAEAFNDTLLRNVVATECGTGSTAIQGWRLLKRSIDARGRMPFYQLRLQVFINEPLKPLEPFEFLYPDVSQAAPVIIVGAGPAGLFAALRLIELGLKPILLERGKDVRSRRRDLAKLNREGEVNPESNYCFGEGGAGTYSDGKLYTRSSKRGSVERILHRLVQHGVDASILADAHPHIGTNKLPQVVTALRDKILACGGEIVFNSRVTDFIISNNQIHGVHTAHGAEYLAKAVLLATGHSARDIFQLLHHKNVLIEAKPFALGIRMEHPQHLIDQQQYHSVFRDIHLPPASYNIVQQVADRGVFSFCMCPGGIIAAAATAAGEIVVNGWSPSSRNNSFANSGFVVQVNEQDYQPGPAVNSPLAAMQFQQAVEQKCFAEGGGRLQAPAQRLIDFVNGKTSSKLPKCSYHPGLTSVDLQAVLPSFVAKSLKGALQQMGKRMKTFYTNEAVLVATESRTSSPVRIPRDKVSLQHPQVSGLFPCGEGAGYAGGIMSAAMDGENCAVAISQYILQG